MHEAFRHASRRLHIPADTDLLPHADLALIFGNSQLVDELADAATRLYQQGRAHWFLATGGVMVDAQSCEADAIGDALIRRGVPERMIIRETRSRNTEENIVFGKASVDDRIGLEHIDSVIGIGHAAAGPRFLMTLAMRWPGVLPMHVSVFPKDVDPDGWWENAAFLSKARADSVKLPFYGRSRYVAPLLPEAANRAVAAYTHDPLCLKAG